MTDHTYINKNGGISKLIREFTDEHGVKNYEYDDGAIFINRTLVDKVYPHQLYSPEYDKFLKIIHDK